jgi:hypothetical protein
MSNRGAPELVFVKLRWTYIYIISNRGICVMFNIAFNEGTLAVSYKSAYLW